MNLRCAVYLRYSKGGQSPHTIQDQLRNCREYAERQGWIILADYIYVDEALSGADADRPEVVRLQQDATSTPRPFDVLLLDDTSRMSRNQGETARMFEHLTFLGIRIVAVTQGIDINPTEAATVRRIFEMAADGCSLKTIARTLNKKGVI